MSAVEIFDALHDAGLSVSLAPGGGLVVSPGSRLTPDLRELVKTNKSALVDWLEAANDPASSEPTAQKNLIKPAMAQAENNPAGAVLPGLVQPPAPDLDKPVKRLKYVDWMDRWREQDQAYQRHHSGCPQCKAAGRGAGYGVCCDIGAALWRAYEDASEDRSALDW